MYEKKWELLSMDYEILFSCQYFFQGEHKKASLQPYTKSNKTFKKKL